MQTYQYVVLNAFEGGVLREVGDIEEILRGGITFGEDCERIRLLSQYCL